MHTTDIRYRLAGTTALHRGDRLYQQDQVEIMPHPRAQGCLLGIVADGMGGKSGGRKAADQVIMTSCQVFDRYSPSSEDAEECLRSLVHESHLMIKLTAMAFEEEPHSTLAAFLVNPDRSAAIVHVGDSRVYWFKQTELAFRTTDHSYVQHMISEGKLTEAQANVHPQSNLLTGCLGTQQDPPISIHRIDQLEAGDTLLACSDGLWHYFTPLEIGAIVHTLPPREAAETLISKARHRARGSGDNLSLALVRLDIQP
jgi:PPM family protein phosphatase